jgi:murein endopeptidase
LRRDPIESARAHEMLTPFELIAGLWLGVWPAWGGALVPAFPLPSPKAIPTAASPAREIPAASLLDLSDEELAKRIESDPGALGSVSIGTPGSAVLFNAVALEPGPRWEIAPGSDSWGTAETMAAIQTVIDTVYELFPETSPLSIGDISGIHGGRLKRHESHQAGRDVDIGYYYKPGKGTWFTPGTAANLDLPRNWALVRAMLVRTDVETIFLDTRIQQLLYKYALSIAEDKDWLDRVFQFSKGSRSAIIQHLPNHRTHYHVRFYNPVAQELGRRAHPILVQLKLMDPPVFTVQHVVQRGQTLGHLAARYGTSVRAIMQANGLVTTTLVAGRTYRIPVRTAAPPAQPLVVPPRMLPPQTPPAMAAVNWPTLQSLYGPSSER